MKDTHRSDLRHHTTNIQIQHNNGVMDDICYPKSSSWCTKSQYYNLTSTSANMLKGHSANTSVCPWSKSALKKITLHAKEITEVYMKKNTID